jgi:hypothetical protein
MYKIKGLKIKGVNQILFLKEWMGNASLKIRCMSYHLHEKERERMTLCLRETSTLRL